MVSPSHKKEAVEHVVRQRLCSVRRACRYLGLSRSTYRYRPRPLTARQQQQHERIVALSWQCPRYGYRRIRALLSAEGWPVSREQVQRIRRREGLKVAPKPKEDPASGRIHRTPDSGLLSKPRVELGFSLRPNGEWRDIEDEDAVR